MINSLPNVMDEVDRARAIVKTVWLALDSGRLDANDKTDIEDLGDTLYEALRRLEGASAYLVEANDAAIEAFSRSKVS